MKAKNVIKATQLIAMTVFIIVIVAVGVYFFRMKYNEARVETIRTDMLQVQWKIKEYMDKQTVNGEETKYLGTKLSEEKEDQVLVDFFNANVIPESEYEKYYVLKDEDLIEAGLGITNYQGSYFLVNYENYEIIVTKGCEYSDSEILYTLTDISNKEESNETNSKENNEEINEASGEESNEEEG